MTDRNEITKGILNLLPDGHAVDLETARLTWYYNIRESGGFRLTPQGFHILNDVLKIESWSIQLSDPKKELTKKLVFEMDRKLKWPFYINFKKKSVIFFSSREAMMATLYGDLKKWLESL